LSANFADAVTNIQLDITPATIATSNLIGGVIRDANVTADLIDGTSADVTNAVSGITYEISDLSVIEARNVYRELLATAAVQPVSFHVDSGPLVPPPLPLAKPGVY